MKYSDKMIRYAEIPPDPASRMIDIDVSAWNPAAQSIYHLVKILYEYYPYEMQKIDLSTLPKFAPKVPALKAKGLEFLTVDYKGNILMAYINDQFIIVHERDFKTY